MYIKNILLCRKLGKTQQGCETFIRLGGYCLHVASFGLLNSSRGSGDKPDKGIHREEKDNGIHNCIFLYSIHNANCMLKRFITLNNIDCAGD